MLLKNEFKIFYIPALLDLVYRSSYRRKIKKGQSEWNGLDYAKSLNK